MKLAIMQPYVFPYLGYFQLITAVDKFIFYDDVTYIKQGWINRNKIIVSGKENMFTVPLDGASSNRLIKEIGLNRRHFPKWRDKFYKTVEQSYGKAPFFNNCFNIIVDVMSRDHESISDLAKDSITQISTMVGLNTEFVRTSSMYNNSTLKAQQRVIDICKKVGASTYINAIGGKELYDREAFLHQNIKLNFIKPNILPYRQGNTEFVPYLSIIDVLMYNSSEDVSSMLSNYDLV